MKKTAKNKSLLLLILISAIFLIVVSGILTTKKSSTTELDPKEPPQSSSESKFRIFKSSPTLKFTINIPQDYLPEEKFSTVTFTSNKGKILLTRNGTNFLRIVDYLDYFDSKRKLTVSENKEIKIENYQAISRIMTFPEEKIKQKSIFLYIDNNVYIISTNNESLFSDLDQIAQSFRYTP